VRPREDVGDIVHEHVELVGNVVAPSAISLVISWQ